MHITFVLPLFREKFHPDFIHTFWVDRLKLLFLPMLEKDSDISFSVIMGKHVADYWNETYPDDLKKMKHIYIVDSIDLKRKVANFPFYNAAHRAFDGTLPPKAIEIIQSGIKNNFQTTTPDILIRFFCRADFIDDCFKDTSLKCTFSEGGVTRPPFPIAWKYDPYGFAKNGLASSWIKENIETTEACSPEITNFLEAYRSKIKDLLGTDNPFGVLISSLREKYKNLLLLPLQVSGRPSFDCITNYKDQVEFLYDILLRTPKETAVIVTEHPQYPVLSNALIEQIQRDFPFAIIDKTVLSTLNSSMYLMPYVDGMVTASSSLVWLAVLLMKRLFIIGEGEFFPLTTSLELKKLFTVSFAPYRFDNVLYKLLTEFWILQDSLHDPEKHIQILKGYLQRGSFEKTTRIQTPEKLLEKLGKRKSSPQKKEVYAELHNSMQSTFLQNLTSEALRSSIETDKRWS